MVIIMSYSLESNFPSGDKNDSININESPGGVSVIKDSDGTYNKNFVATSLNNIYIKEEPLEAVDESGWGPLKQESLSLKVCCIIIIIAA